MASNGVEDEPQELPMLPSRLLNLGDGAREVVDADEEVFILYTLHPAPAGRTGLGQVDSHHDVLAIRFDLDDDEMPEVESTAAAEMTARATSSSSKTTKRSKGSSSSNRGAAKTAAQASSSSRIELIVNQDSTSLRSTTGDTGSVVWRSSVRLGACLVRQLHKPPYGHSPLLNSSALAGANILELGSGTGVLPAIMLPLLSRSGGPPNWVATDQEAMLPLLRKNMEQLAARSGGAGVSVAEVDWVDCANQLRSKTAYAGGIDAVRRRVMEAFGPSTSSLDLVIAVDCVFNPSLFSPLIDTLDVFTEPDKTLVLVVIELRSSEATMAFLETWLEVARGWKICAIPSEQLSCGLDKGYVAWVGWKTREQAPC